MIRRKTQVVNIGDVPLGGDYPVRVQSMTNLPTADIDGQIKQILKCAEAGAEYMRITVPTLKDVEHFKKIKKGIRGFRDSGIQGFGDSGTQGLGDSGTRGFRDSGTQGLGDSGIPLIADVHFSPKIAVEVAKIADKVRINPGNFVTKVTQMRADYTDELFQVMHPLIQTCKDYGTALRIGTNHGSLSERIMELYGNTPEGMVVATMEAVEVCQMENFHDIVLSLKSSNVRVMTEATRLLVQRLDEKGWNYPVHLGVTEAGDGDDGRIKSAVGIGSLLVDGIGDTIRVSLTEDPENEIPVAYNILQASRSRITKTDYIACPGCGRTQFALQDALQKVKAATSHLTGLKIAVMGCIVNGPGEMADADYGYVGAGNGKVNLYKGKTLVSKNIPEERAIEELLKLIG